MSARNTLARAAAAGLSALALLAAAGCGDDSGLPQRYAVRGKVTYKGEPVPSGTVIFEPADAQAGRVAQGPIQDGSYSLSTAGEGGDGALPGDYKVAIISKTVDMSKVEANRGGGAGRQDDVIKAEKSAKRLIPKKYEQSANSELKAKVEPKSNTIDFDLTD